MSGKQTSSESYFVGRLTTVFQLADAVAELELWGRRVGNCWRLHMMVALNYVTLVNYGVDWTWGRHFCLGVRVKVTITLRWDCLVAQKQAQGPH